MWADIVRANFSQNWEIVLPVLGQHKIATTVIRTQPIMR